MDTKSSVKKRVKEIKKNFKKEEEILEHEFNITKESIRRELAYIAFASITDIFSWDDKDFWINDQNVISRASLKAIKNLSIKNIKTKKGYMKSFSITLQDRITALVALGKSIGMFSNATPIEEKQEDSELILEELHKSIELYFKNDR